LKGARRAVRSIFASLVSLAAFAATFPADAREPLLHEFVPSSDSEDVSMAVTTPSGDLPAALDTKSGVVHAPDTARAPSPAEQAYSEPLVPSTSPTYHPDRDTRRPSVVRYQDPFSPSTAPYKRLHAYDSVAAGYALKVRDTSLAEVPTGGALRPGEDAFYADLAVDFESNSSVLIPSVGPGARILRQHATPNIPIDVWRDGADNWYAHTAAPRPGRVRLVMEVAIAREAMGGEFDMPGWSNLAHPSPLPAGTGAAQAFAKVAAVIGLSRTMSPAENTKKLVAYFRSFAPSDDPPRATGDVYLDLALSKKGVCRHRAFAFLVTALGMGIPARMVLNEAHAWVEVLGRRWQRIDLGGAAAEIEEGIAQQGPSYEPPGDPFAWPPGAETSSGRQAAARGQEGQGRSPGSMTSSRDGAPSSGDRASPPPSSVQTQLRDDPPGTDGDRGSDGRPRSTITLLSGDANLRRGAPLAVSGNVQAKGGACGQLRVDVALRAKASERDLEVGSLTTDSDGRFIGNVYLPLGFPVGEYELSVSTPGDARCGSGVLSR
jgi:transglutaminase-like putative cysteine protease